MGSIASRHADVLILGGGFAGVGCAQRLEKLLEPDQSIVLVSSENYFVFQPLLPEVVGASLDPGHVISPLRHLLRRSEVVRGEVCGIELLPDRQAVAGRVTVAVPGTEGRVVFTTGHLVLALGSIVDVSRQPGMAEHSFLMKNVADALALRHGIIARLERAVLESDAEVRRALLTFVVVGGGFSGIETAAEMNDLVKHARRFFPTLCEEEMRVVCVHSKDRILPELDARLGTYAHKLLARRGVEFRMSEKVRAVSGEGVYLASGDTIKARTVVCTVGNAPHPMLKGLGEEFEGRLLADPCLRLKDRTNVWTLGDCARAPDGRGGFAPPTAQFASRQGDVAARNIVATMQGQPLTPFRHKSLGQLATLGHRNAVASLGRVCISGFFAWWLWRTVYLAKLPRLDRKLRVVIDWTLNLFFPRDLNFLDTATTRGRTSVHLEKGEILFRQGDPSATFYVLRDGRIELTRCDDAGNVIARDELGPGQHFGEGSLLRSRVRTTTARALEASRVLAFPAQEFTLLVSCFGALRDLLQRTSRRFQPMPEVIPAWVPADMLRMPVSRIMSSPVYTMPVDATLDACLGQFLGRNINSFPLVDAAGRLAGLVTSTDLFTALRRDVDLKKPLLDLATQGVRCLSPEDSVAGAVEIMRRHDVRHAVVVDADRHVVGIVSMKDVLRLILAAAPSVAAARPGPG